MATGVLTVGKHPVKNGDGGVVGCSNNGKVPAGTAEGRGPAARLTDHWFKRGNLRVADIPHLQRISSYPVYSYFAAGSFRLIIAEAGAATGAKVMLIIWLVLYQRLDLI